MKKKIILVLIVLATLIPLNANAGIFSNTSNNVIKLISKLSDDIGIMADRILVMADKIGEMADRILIMSDKIVETENLMSDTLLQMQDTMDKSSNTNTLSQTNSVLLLTPNHTATTSNIAPEIILSDNSSTYLLYVSTSPMIDALNNSSVLVQDISSIDTIWHDLLSKTSAKTIYIAVKSLHENKLSSISNAVAIDIN